MKTRKQRGGLNKEQWEQIKPIVLANSDKNTDGTYSVSYKTILPFLVKILEKEPDDRERGLISAVMEKYLGTSFNFEADAEPLRAEKTVEGRFVYVLGENHRVSDKTTTKLIEITSEETEFLLFTESVSPLEKRTAIGMKPCIPIPYSVENLVMILTFFYGMKEGNPVIPSFQKRPSDMIRLLMLKELKMNISEAQLMNNPNSVLDIIKKRIATLCTGKGEMCSLILSQLPSITFESITAEIKSHPIVKASLELVDELIIENITTKDKVSPVHDVFIIIVGQNHFDNIVSKLSELGFLVKGISYSEKYSKELELSGGKRKKRRTKRKRRKKLISIFKS